MPNIYQGICSNCGYETDIMPDSYGAVWVDAPVTHEQTEIVGMVALSPISGEIEKVNDSRFVVLAHPLEESALKSTGYTWQDLFWQGRYVRVTKVICRQCGAVFSKKQLEAPSVIGCFAALAFAVVIGVVLGFWLRSIFAGIVVVFGVVIFTFSMCEILLSSILRYRFSDKAAQLAAENNCPKCHADDSVIFDKAKSVKCAQCQESTLTVRCVGMS